ADDPRDHRRLAARMRDLRGPAVVPALRRDGAPRARIADRPEPRSLPRRPGAPRRRRGPPRAGRAPRAIARRLLKGCPEEREAREEEEALPEARDRLA